MPLTLHEPFTRQAIAPAMKARGGSLGSGRLRADDRMEPTRALTPGVLAAAATASDPGAT